MNDKPVWELTDSELEENMNALFLGYGENEAKIIELETRQQRLQELRQIILNEMNKRAAGHRGENYKGKGL